MSTKAFHFIGYSFSAVVDVPLIYSGGRNDPTGKYESFVNYEVSVLSSIHGRGFNIVYETKAYILQSDSQLHVNI